MPDLMKMELLGAKETSDVIKKLPPELAKKVYTAALRKGANVFRDAMKEAAPTDSKYNRRHTMSKGKGQSKRTEFIKLRNEIKVSFTKISTISFELAIHVGRAFWGMFLEYGTTKMGARPWARPVYETKKEEALDVTGKALGEGVEKTAARLAGPLNKSGLLRRR
jgi:HK97 gp10 family phage protein